MSSDQILKCPVCHYSVSPNMKNCPNCGTWLGLSESEQVSENLEPEATEKSDIKSFDKTEHEERQKPENQDEVLQTLISENHKLSCPHCGGFHSSEAKFCPKTGKSIRTDKASIPLDPTATRRRASVQTRMQRRKKLLCIIGLVIGIPLFVGIAIASKSCSKQNGLLQIATSPNHTFVSQNVPVSEQTYTLVTLNSPTKTLLPSASPTTNFTFTITPTYTPLPTSSATATSTPNFKPTGQIVFTCYIDSIDHICSMGADGSNQHRLTHAEATDFYASWSPNGRVIVFSSRRDDSFQLYTMIADGEDESRLSYDLGTGGLFSPAYSPSGNRIIFTRAEGGAQNIWVMNTDGTNAIPLTNTNGDNVDPVWSPDGHQIAFSSNRSEETGIYIMDADGGDAHPLGTDVSDMGGRIDWSPDGQWIAFYAGERGSRNIYLIAVDGSELRQLTFTNDNLAPSFSSDGNWVAFMSTRDEDSEIFIMRVDGSEVRQLTHNTRPDWQPRWGP